MNIRETIKEKTLRLIGLILIVIPLMACYPLLFYIGLSVKISTIITVCLSIIAYILLVTRIEPLLGSMLPFLSPITQTEFTSAELKMGSIDVRKVHSPNSFSTVSKLDIRSSQNAIRNLKGNWAHS